MPDYRRNRVPGRTLFLTLNLSDLQSDLLVTQIVSRGRFEAECAVRCSALRSALSASGRVVTRHLRGYFGGITHIRRSFSGEIQ